MFLLHSNKYIGGPLIIIKQGSNFQRSIITMVIVYKKITYKEKTSLICKFSKAVADPVI